MTLTMFFLSEISPIWLNLKFLKENLAKFIHIFNKNKKNCSLIYDNNSQYIYTFCLEIKIKNHEYIIVFLTFFTKSMIVH
jgi:hypothetical protein